MRTAAFLRNVPILACLPDESLERLAAQVNDVLIGLMDWKALPHVVARDGERRVTHSKPAQNR